MGSKLKEWRTGGYLPLPPTSRLAVTSVIHRKDMNDILRFMSFISVYVIIDSVIFIDWIFIEDVLWLITYECWLIHTWHSSFNVMSSNMSFTRDILRSTSFLGRFTNMSSLTCWIHQYVIIDNVILIDDVHWLITYECLLIHTWHSSFNVMYCKMWSLTMSQSKNIIDEYSINEYHAVNDHIHWNEWHWTRNITCESPRVNDPTFICDESVNIINDHKVIHTWHSSFNLIYSSVLWSLTTWMTWHSYVTHDPIFNMWSINIHIRSINEYHQWIFNQ